MHPLTGIRGHTSLSFPTELWSLRDMVAVRFACPTELRTPAACVRAACIHGKKFRYMQAFSL
ncbi:MAG: hypothetical protein K5846_08780 [Bacteroidales bacterium]|nr:hypothetical protein [Bacteroidales bacterium]